MDLKAGRVSSGAIVTAEQEKTAVALSRIARVSGWRPYVIDPRGRFAHADRFPDAEAVIVAWPV